MFNNIVKHFVLLYGQNKIQMNNQKVMEELIYRIYLAPGTDYVTMEWRGYANSQQFRKGTEIMLEELRKHKVNKVLGNIREMVLISAEDHQCLQDTFLPRAIEHGFKALALVRPVHYFNKVAVESVAYKVQDESLKIRMFNEVAEAVDWLDNCPVK
jgi:hypothetical protein